VKFILRTKNGLHVSTELSPRAGGNNIMFFYTKAEAMFAKKELVDRINSQYVASWVSELFVEEVADDYEY
jgi:hypothetical protein